MSDDQAQPPHGSQQDGPLGPPADLPQYPSPPPGAAPAPAAWGAPQAGPPPAGMLSAAHKPGAMPLRPLGLGDIYDAAFRIIRFNPKATVGSAVLVASVIMLIPVIISGIFTFTMDLTLTETGEIDAGSSDSEFIGAAVSFGSIFGGAILLQIGLIFVTGMIAHVSNAAAIGQRLTLGEAWAATRGKRWKLLGLTAVINLATIVAVGVYVGLWFLVFTISATTALVVVWGLVTVPAFLAALAWFWVRIYYLPAPILMLEPVGVFDAIRRGFRLTHGQFWRIFGIGLLTLIITTVAGALLSGPVTIAGEIAAMAVPEYAVLGLAITQAISSIISTAFVAPFAGAVTSLMYIDQRMRKEAFDIELMSRAGITTS